MHRLHPLITNIEPPQRFTFPFCYEPHPLCVIAAEEVQHYLASVAEWQDELSRGKMFGVLVVSNGDEMGFFAAFSGLFQGTNDLPYFVPPVYDLLQKDGHFKREENEITKLNHHIADIENSDGYKEAKRSLDNALREAETAISEFRAEANRRKANAEGDERVKLSQFLNAELRRKKKRFSDEIDEKRTVLSSLEAELTALRQKRKGMSDELQRWLFSQYRMLNARGESRDLCDIFSATVGRVPPSGAGECCAPKLLQYAYTHGMQPLCMAEFWWGASPKSEVRHHLHYYPACRGKCKPILEHMLQGLDVDPDPRTAEDNRQLRLIYNDDYICVVEKPAGMLSVPGKSDRRSVLTEVRRLFPTAEGPMIVHRLDMDTSGLMIVAKTYDAYVNLQRQFLAHTVRKTYTALLSRRPECATEGTISLPLLPDHLDRPRQKVDFDNGKEAITRYRLHPADEHHPYTVCTLWPQTGRTHQLRVHCAHPDGLNAPIVGDTLYGRPDRRLCLHAERIEFLHPATGEKMVFEWKVNDFGV